MVVEWVPDAVIGPAAGAKERSRDQQQCTIPEQVKQGFELCRPLIFVPDEISTHVQRCLANAQAHHGLNAFISLADRSFLEAAAQKVDSIREPGGPLNGKLIAVKDNICTSDFPTTAASYILKNFNSSYDATVVRRLRESGAIITGKTNLDEFGMGSHSTFSHFGSVKNPHNHHAQQPPSAGGSSGGSAVAEPTPAAPSASPPLTPAP
ncbi:MAG: hypothetical protein Q9157_003733 [Trypethelium eluteriae]